MATFDDIIKNEKHKKTLRESFGNLRQSLGKGLSNVSRSYENPYSKIISKERARQLRQKVRKQVLESAIKKEERQRLMGYTKNNFQHRTQQYNIFTEEPMNTKVSYDYGIPSNKEITQASIKARKKAYLKTIMKIEGQRGRNQAMSLYQPKRDDSNMPDLGDVDLL